MPGYVMHLAEVDMVLGILRESRDLSEQWVQRFVTGNLLPDTKLQKEKFISHFWNPANAGQIGQAPDLALFGEKYQPDMNDPLLLGYLMHLHMDAQYVHNFWPRCIAFYNSEGMPETRTEYVSEVEIIKTGQRVPLKEFFSPALYYGDYGRMNGFFVRKYHIRKPEWEEIKDFHMDEVELSDMEKICEGLDWLFAHCSPDDDPELKVFDLKQFEDFIRRSAEEFVQQYIRKTI